MFTPPRRITVATVGDGFRLLRIEPARALRPSPGQYLWLRTPGVEPRAYRPMRVGDGHVDCLLTAEDPLAAGTLIEVGPLCGEALVAAAPTLLIVGDTPGFAALVHTALALAPMAERALALYETGSALPFRPRISKIIVPGIPEGVIAALPPLEDAGVASRAADPTGLRAGCFDGNVAELARIWLTEPTTGPVHLIASGGDDLLASLDAIACQHVVHMDRLPANPRP